MDRVKTLCGALALAACLVGGYGAAARDDVRPRAEASAAPAQSFFAQSAAQILNREFAGDEVSYLLLDARDGALLAARWPAREQPIPLGSLVKPFAALAYAQQHAYRYPVYVCHGAAGGCWRPQAHGRLNISTALANSCNSYFRELTSGLTGKELREVAQQFGLDAPATGLSGAALMGIGDAWPISPMHMARAYLELDRRRAEPGVSEIVAGLAESAQWGTGSGVDRGRPHGTALVKTGTAACRHAHWAPGDGFAVALVPAEQPKVLLMVRVHGAPGSKAAETAGRMLARLEQ